MERLPRFLQQFTFLLTVIAAVASLRVMYSVGSDQESILLIVLFTGWVISAFIALLILNLVLGRLKFKLQIVVHILTVVINITAVLLYNGLFNLPDMKPAAIFLIVPFGMWVILLVSFLLLRRHLRGNGSV
ncbi:MAG TPA: hypothetical protein PLR06_10905 [Cyclobacteriaceae bacterium]|nr:hypothetical protein [Cyclobacteriaceae bacterium]